MKYIKIYIHLFIYSKKQVNKISNKNKKYIYVYIYNLYFIRI